MGLLDKAKNALTGGGEEQSEADEIAEEWGEDVESEVEESEDFLEDEEEVEEEPEVREWDSAYKFAEEYLEMRGFASMVDFTNKCMAHKINQSPMYRDKISNGVETMNQISTMQQQMEQLRGGGDGSKSMKEKAAELEAANEVIDQAQKLNGQEDEMVRDVIGLGEDLVQVMAEGRGRKMRSGDVNSSVESTDERL